MSKYHFVAALAVGTIFAADYHIDNRTTSVEVVSMTDDAQARGLPLMQVVLKNTSKKRIETLMVGMEDWTFMRDVNIFHGGMPPGTTLTFDVPPLTQRPGGVDSLGSHDFHIFAVVFDDKTADGDAAAIDRVFDDRAGKKQQYARLLDLIENVERNNSGDTRSTFNELVRRVAELPESTDVSTKKWVGAGASALRNAKVENLKRLLSTDKAQDNEYLRSRLAALKDECKLFANSL